MPRRVKKPLSQIILEVLEENGGSMKIDDLVMAVRRKRPTAKKRVIKAVITKLKNKKKLSISGDTVKL